jgi:hypothetical protein
MVYFQASISERAATQLTNMRRAHINFHVTDFVSSELFSSDETISAAATLERVLPFLATTFVISMILFVTGQHHGAVKCSYTV